MKAPLRFLLLGGLTTAASYLTYVLALQAMAPHPAYAIALAVAFVIQTALMAPLVFQSRLTAMRALRSLAIYAAYSLLFAALMAIVLWLGAPPLIAPLLVIAVAAPLQFLAGRRWVRD